MSYLILDAKIAMIFIVIYDNKIVLKVSVGLCFGLQRHMREVNIRELCLTFFLN